MLTIHHLQVSQSERLVWLCEELNIPYNLQLHQRSPIFSPESLTSLHPLGQAPIIQDSTSTSDEKPLTLAESGACIEYIIQKYGSGKLIIKPGEKGYEDYIYFFHFANSGFQAMLSRLMTLKFAGLSPTENEAYARMMERFYKQLEFLDRHLERKKYLAGDQLTAADIMIVFSLTTMRTFNGYDLSEHKHILAYLKTVAERDGYKAAREKGDPELALMIDGPPPEDFLAKLQRQQK